MGCVKTSGNGGGNCKLTCIPCTGTTSDEVQCTPMYGGVLKVGSADGGDMKQRSRRPGDPILRVFFKVTQSEYSFAVSISSYCWLFQSSLMLVFVTFGVVDLT